MPESPIVVRELTERIFIELCCLRYLEERKEGACDQDAVDADIKAIEQKVVDLRRMRTELEDLLALS